MVVCNQCYGNLWCTQWRIMKYRLNQTIALMYGNLLLRSKQANFDAAFNKSVSQYFKSNKRDLVKLGTAVSWRCLQIWGHFKDFIYWEKISC